jgi:glycerophosphoryl diester phosphodiesterase
VAQLLRLDAGAWKGPQWAGQPIPSLSAVLAEMPAESRALVEIKVGPEAVPALARTVAASGLSADRITAISFNAGTVAAARRLLPGHRAYLLGGLRRKGDATPPETAPDRLIREAVAIGAHGLNLGVDDAIDGAFVRRVEAAGLALYVWTVDDAPTARRLIAAGVDGITSNRAAALRVECGAGP